MSYKNLFKHIDQKVTLTAEEKEVVPAFFRVKKLRRRQFLLQEGDICIAFAFVSEGLLKSYVLDEKGNENVNLFGWEGWWIADFQSFLFQTPATHVFFTTWMRGANEEENIQLNSALALLFRCVIKVESSFVVR